MSFVYNAGNYLLNNIAVLLPIILTAVYVYLTYRLLKTSQKQTSVTVRPYVSFDLIPVGPVIAAHLRNTGQTAAHDVVVTVKPELLVTLFGKTGPAKLIGHSTTILSPGREEIEVIGSWPELRAVAPSLSYTGTVAYSETSGVRHTEPFRIELLARGEMMRIGTPSVAEGIQAISEHLNEIKKMLEKMASSGHGRLAETPSSSEETTSVADGISFVAQEAPLHTQETPSAAERTPSALEQTPSMTEETPSLTQKTPSAGDGVSCVAPETSSGAPEAPFGPAEVLSNPPEA